VEKPLLWLVVGVVIVLALNAGGGRSGQQMVGVAALAIFLIWLVSIIIKCVIIRSVNLSSISIGW
jgi:hypothetical protein